MNHRPWRAGGDSLGAHPQGTRSHKSRVGLESVHFQAFSSLVQKLLVQEPHFEYHCYRNHLGWLCPLCNWACSFTCISRKLVFISRGLIIFRLIFLDENISCTVLCTSHWADITRHPASGCPTLGHLKIDLRVQRFLFDFPPWSASLSAFYVMVLVSLDDYCL